MLKNNTEDNFIIVIRSSDERTFEVCRRLLEQQSSPEQVTFVKLTPFKRALEECFRIGITSKKKWLITADADMLLLPNSIDLLIRQANQMPDNYLQLQGKIFDKITGTIRKAGPRVYRVKYLQKALDYSLDSKDSIRPEGNLVTALSKQGMPSRYISSVTAYHDFQQYYKDLYRKAYVHAIKHQAIAGQLIQRSIEMKEQDKDFQIILRAVMDGLEKSEEIYIDTNLFHEKSKKALKDLAIEEKKPIDHLQNPTKVLESIQKNKPLKYDSPVFFLDQPSPKKKFSDNIIRIIKRDGLIKGSLHGVGIFMEKLGRNLQIHR